MAVNVKMTPNGIALEGPKDFIDNLDQAALIRKTEMFAPFQPEPLKALEVALQTMYAEYRGAKTLRY